ncbi:hypothetical protein JCM10207_007582 [Rhodosporidiobolus poonsookiae]
MTRSQRQPLQPLPLEHFLLPTSSSLRSPNKRMAGLLPSPFLQPTASPRSRGPLVTLHETPLSASPARRAGASSARLMQEDDTAQPDGDELQSSPRRLLDAFLGASDRRKPGGVVGSSPSSSRRSMPPPSPRRQPSPFVSRLQDKEEQPEPPTWSFFEDDGDEAAGPIDVPAPTDSALMSSDEGEDAMPVDKENNRPPPRRCRSTSLLSRASTPTLAAPSPVTTSSSRTPSAPASLSASVNPSPARPAPPVLTLPSGTSGGAAPALVEGPRTPPGSSSPAFPSYLEAPSALAAFSESAAQSFSPVLSSEGDGPLRGSALGGAARKRPSLEQAGGDGKRRREE